MASQKKERVDKKTWDAWKLAFYDTSYEELTSITGLSKPTLTAAIIHGLATAEVVELLNAAFKQLKEKVA